MEPLKDHLQQQDSFLKAKPLSYRILVVLLPQNDIDYLMNRDQNLK